MKAKPVTMPSNGMTYESVNAAARAFGVTPSCIREARGRGDLMNVGTYYGNPITLDGVTYPTRKEAAYQLGVDVTLIHSRIQRARKKEKLTNEG